MLAGGGTVVLPTDTVYGLAALPSRRAPRPDLFALKDRAADHPLAVLVADLDQALELVEVTVPDVSRWMAELWPGPLTIVLRRSAVSAGLDLGGDADTIGVRCPDHQFVRALAAEVGPDRHHQRQPHGRADARSPPSRRPPRWSGAVDLVVDGGPAGTAASTVVDASSASRGRCLPIRCHHRRTAACRRRRSPIRPVSHPAGAGRSCWRDDDEDRLRDHHRRTGPDLLRAANWVDSEMADIVSVLSIVVGALAVAIDGEEADQSTKPKRRGT